MSPPSPPTHRWALPGVLALATAACATSPISITRTVDRPMADLYTCAMQQLARLDYTLANADRESGFIQARKQTSGLGTRLFSGQNHHNAITVAIFENGRPDESVFRVTVGQIIEQATGWSQGAESLGKPSGDGEGEALELVATCAPSVGEVRAVEDD